MKKSRAEDGERRSVSFVLCVFSVCVCVFKKPIEKRFKSLCVDKLFIGCLDC